MSDSHTVRVEDGKIYLGGQLVALVTGDDIRADQVSVIQQARVRTMQEQIRDNINARLRAGR